MSSYGAAAIALLMLVFSAPSTPASTEQGLPRWLGGGAKAEEYQPFQAPAGKFSLEFPKRDWQTVSGVGSVIVVFSQAKTEASVAVEHAGLKQALAPEDITQLFVDLEVQNVKERDAKTGGFRTALRTGSDGRRVIAIDFTRQGLHGVEQVRQFSLPSGSDLFRLICSASPAVFDRYAPVFEHMAESFKIGPAAAPVAK
jgi:hypothetical protein